MDIPILRFYIPGFNPNTCQEVGSTEISISWKYRILVRAPCLRNCAPDRRSVCVPTVRIRGQ